MSVKYGTIVRQMWSILKKQYPISIGIIPLKTYVDEKVKLLNETLLNIFRNYIPNKKIKWDYQQPPWITDKIKTLLKERCK